MSVWCTWHVMCFKIVSLQGRVITVTYCDCDSSDWCKPTLKKGSVHLTREAVIPKTLPFGMRASGACRLIAVCTTDIQIKKTVSYQLTIVTPLLGAGFIERIIDWPKNMVYPCTLLINTAYTSITKLGANEQHFRKQRIHKLNAYNPSLEEFTEVHKAGGWRDQSEKMSSGTALASGMGRN